jgi:hypothetical protein
MQFRAATTQTYELAVPCHPLPQGYSAFDDFAGSQVGDEEQSAAGIEAGIVEARSISGQKQLADKCTYPGVETGAAEPVLAGVLGIRYAIST